MRRETFVLLAGVLALFATAWPVPAQDSGAKEVRLTVEQCRRMALENNLDLVIARMDPAIAEQQIAVEQARFDGVFGGSVNYTDDSNDQTITDNTNGQSNDGTSDSDTVTASASWSNLLEFGAEYDVTLNFSDFGSASKEINQFTGFFQDQQFDNTSEGITLRYEMPLLRGLGREVTTSSVILARSGLDISREDLRLQAIQTIKDTEDAYWDLLAAREAARVARESLTLARDLYELNKKKVEVGTLAPIEITQAEAGVASREEDVIVADVTVENAEDNLRRLLGIPKGDPAWMQRIVPVDQPQFEDRKFDLEAALAAALENRPEMINARQALKDQELSERVARDGVRHSLSLVAEVNPSRAENEFRQTFIGSGFPPTNTATDTDGLEWQVGLTYGYPLRNRSAKANYAIATLNREKSEAGLRNTEQSIRVDVRTAVRNVESGVKRVAAARASAFLQRKTLEAEQKKFENGMSTSFEVLRIQTDLSDAQLAEIRAILDYNKSLADLERAKGTLLQSRGLRLEGS